MAKTNTVVTLILSLVVISSLVTVGCDKANSGGKSPPSSPEISMEEAKAILDQAVAYAQARNLGGLCQLNGSVNMCQHQFTDAGGWVTVPSEPPTIADTYCVPTVHFKNGFQATGGRVLVLEGINGVGEPYRTEFLVFETDDQRRIGRTCRNQRGLLVRIRHC